MSRLVLCCVQMSVLPIISWYVGLNPLFLHTLLRRSSVTLNLTMALTSVVTRSYPVA